MNKKRLLYFSPIVPMKSGISDYSEALLETLAEHFDIVLAIDPPRIVNPGLYNVNERSVLSMLRPEAPVNYPLLLHGIDEIDPGKFDFVIYNVGNNPHYHSYMYDYVRMYPGLIILHDYILYYLVVGRYWSNKMQFVWKMWSLGGWRALWLQFKLICLKRMHPLHCPSGLVLPLNQEIINSGSKIMVHSIFAKNEIISGNPELEGKVRVIHSFGDYPSQVGSGENEADGLTRSRFGIEIDEILVTSFGYIAPTKLNHLVCEVVGELRQQYPKLVYLMVGEGGYADAYVDGKIIRKTGFIDIHDFERLIRVSDIVINLRSPSMGETSASLIRIMREGKACIVSDDAWFSELPGDVVVKIDNLKAKEQLSEKLKFLLDFPDARRSLGERARALIAKDYGRKKICQQIADYLEG